MSGESKLYVSMGPLVYKAGKSSVLTAQVDLLKIIKHLRTLKRLSKEKGDLKRELHKGLEELSKHLETFDQKMPHPDIPKKFLHKWKKKKQEVRVDKLEEPKVKKHDALDSELLKIQEKLRMLNG